LILLNEKNQPFQAGFLFFLVAGDYLWKKAVFYRDL
jgi:hypothetical protein